MNRVFFGTPLETYYTMNGKTLTSPVTKAITPKIIFNVKTHWEEVLIVRVSSGLVFYNDRFSQINRILVILEI